MIPLRPEVQARGAELYAIGNGTAAMARDFAQRFAVPFPLYTDPTRRSYQLAGLKRKFGIGLRTLGRTVTALAGGHRQGLPGGDNWQQGGALIVRPPGEVVWVHVDEGPDDAATPEQLREGLAALDG